MKNDVKSVIRESYLDDGSVVFTSESVSDELDEYRTDEIESALKDMSNDGDFYCQTIVRCGEEHSITSMTGIPNRNQLYGRNQEPPYCEECCDYCPTPRLDLEHKFVLSQKLRDRWDEEAT